MSHRHKHNHVVGNGAVTVQPIGRATVEALEERPTPPPARPASAEPVVVAQPESARTPLIAPTRAPSQRERAQVRVAPHVLDLVTIPAPTPQATKTAREQRDLNAVVHTVLIIGLALSTALMLVGICIDLFSQQDLPTAVPDLGDVLGRVAALRPSGFLALGLLVLIATPILRVLGSIIAFLYERDWRYAGITTVVLLVLCVSLLLGKG
jgi:uncharacterized membrane protein